MRKYFAALVIAAVIAGSLVPVLQASTVTPAPSTKPSINLKPHMKLIIYPDGSIRILYDLTGSITNIVTNSTGKAYLNITSYETDKYSITNLVGYADIKPLNKVKQEQLKAVALKALFKGHSVGGSYLIAGYLYVLTHSESPKGVNESSYNITLISAKINERMINASVRIAVIGNATKSFISKARELINALKAKGLDWVNLSSIHIIGINKVGDGGKALITGNVVIDLNRLIRDEVSAGLLTQEDSVKVKECIHALAASNTSSMMTLVGKLVTTKYSPKGSGFEGGIAATFSLVGNLSALHRLNTACSTYLSKFSTATSLLVQGALTKPSKPGNPPTFPAPMVPSNIKTPKLIRKHPYRAQFLLKAEVSNKSLTFEITMDSGRLIYPTNESGIGSAKQTLHELRDWLGQMKKQLAILEFAGIPSPLPEEVEVAGASEGGKTVNVGVKEVSLSSIDTLPISVGGKSVTTPPQTSTPQKTVTKTSTTTLVSTKTLTETLVKTKTTIKTVRTTVSKSVTTTETLTKILTSTLTSTVTQISTQTVVKTKPITSTVEGVALLVAFLASLGAAIALALRRR